MCLCVCVVVDVKKRIFLDALQKKLVFLLEPLFLLLLNVYHNSTGIPTRRRPTKMDHEEHVSVSNSKFWKDWRESRVYKLQISVFSGDLLMNAKCDLKPSQMDPYFGHLSGQGQREQQEEDASVEAHYHSRVE